MPSATFDPAVRSSAPPNPSAKSFTRVSKSSSRSFDMALSMRTDGIPILSANSMARASHAMLESVSPTLKSFAVRKQQAVMPRLSKCFL